MRPDFARDIGRFIGMQKRAHGDGSVAGAPGNTAEQMRNMRAAYLKDYPDAKEMSPAAVWSMMGTEDSPYKGLADPGDAAKWSDYAAKAKGPAAGASPAAGAQPVTKIQGPPAGANPAAGATDVAAQKGTAETKQQISGTPAPTTLKTPPATATGRQKAVGAKQAPAAGATPAATAIPAAKPMSAQEKAFQITTPEQRQAAQERAYATAGFTSPADYTAWQGAGESIEARARRAAENRRRIQMMFAR
jgi:hypothetical protein